MTNVRLGTPRPELLARPLTPAEARMLKLFTPRADAVVLLPNEVHIIEAAIRFEPKKITQLEIYEKMFKMTPEFRDHWDKPIVKILLSAQKSPALQKMAEEHGIKFVYYCPDWIKVYLMTLPGRMRRGVYYSLHY